MFGPVDWHGIFVPDVSLLEIFVRGSLLYLGVFILLRLVLRRQPGATGLSDLLLIVLIADASQNAMTGDYHSLPDGILLVGVLIFWSYLIDSLEVRSELVRRFVSPRPVLLVREGHVFWRNLRRERITEEELKTKIREKGFDGIDQVRIARMEGDGELSVLGYQQGQEDSKEGFRKAL